MKTKHPQNTRRRNVAKFEESTDPTERLTFFPDGTALVIRYSPWTGKFNKVTIRLTEEQYNNWHNKRMLIQDAMPHLDKDEREFLMTGYTPTDWATIFPPDEDEDDKDV
jgi:hypothetical protein